MRPEPAGPLPTEKNPAQLFSWADCINLVEFFIASIPT